MHCKQGGRRWVFNFGWHYLWLYLRKIVPAIEIFISDFVIYWNWENTSVFLFSVGEDIYDNSWDNIICRDMSCEELCIWKHEESCIWKLKRPSGVIWRVSHFNLYMWLLSVLKKIMKQKALYLNIYYINKRDIFLVWLSFFPR